MTIRRWNPKAKYVGDRPMYMSGSGKYVSYEDFKELAEERNRLAAELTAALIALGGIDGTTGKYDRRSEAVLSLDNRKGEVQGWAGAESAEAVDN